MKIHTEKKCDSAKEFSCTECAFLCKEKGNMREHMKTHSIAPNESFNCTQGPIMINTSDQPQSNYFDSVISQDNLTDLQLLELIRKND